MIRHLLHLVRRFFSVASAAPLTQHERAWMDPFLDREDLRQLFDAQPVADQRHAFDGARAVAASFAGRADLVRAALLHDIGKRHARLGLIGRSLATVAAAMRIPVRGGMAAYTAHGSVGAQELASVGAEPLVVDFARYHHGKRPGSISKPDWDALIDVDRRY